MSRARTPCSLGSSSTTFCLIRSLERILAGLKVPVHNLFGTVVQPLVIVSVLDQAVFYHLSHAGRILFRGQGAEHGHIAVDHAGHMEGTHHVFVGEKIHSRLSADAAVHLGEQGCGNLNERDAPQIGGGREAAQISDHASAQGYQHIFAVKMFQDQGLIELLDRVQVFMLLPRRKHEIYHMTAAGRKNIRHFIEIEAGHIGICDDADLSPVHKGSGFPFQLLK